MNRTEPPNSEQEPGSPRNPRLVDAMQAVATNDNPETRKELYKALLESTLLVPTVPLPGEETASGPRTLPEGTPMSLMTLSNQQGQIALPVFTDEEAFKLWRPEGGGYTAFAASDLFPLALQNNAEAILVNPAGPSGGQVTRREIAVLAQGTVPAGDSKLEVAADTQVLIAAPADPPVQAITTLQQAAARHPEIDSAYLVLLTIGRGEPHLAAGIGFSHVPGEETLSSTMRDLSDAVHPVLAAGQYVDFIVLDGSDFAQAIERSGIPVFKRDSSV